MIEIVDHLEYMEAHLPAFFEACGANKALAGPIIASHGNKAFIYHRKWSREGIAFAHGVSIYLLTYLPEFSAEVGRTSSGWTDGWIDAGDWVIANRARYLSMLPPAPALMGDELVEFMRNMAMGRHKSQIDKAGKPYFEHCQAVADALPDEDAEVKAAGYGHDLLEDTETTTDELLHAGVPARTVELIKLVTKTGKSYSQYKAAILADEDASRIKKADLGHNMDLSRLPVILEADLQRNKRYAKFQAAILESHPHLAPKQMDVPRLA